VAAGYRAGKDGDSDGDGKDSDNATTLGVVYSAVQNVTLQITEPSVPRAVKKIVL